jgi:hypothetical protein
MKTYRVKVAVRILEIYQVEAEDEIDARDSWDTGDLIHNDDEVLETEILSVEEL